MKFRSIALSVLLLAVAVLPHLALAQTTTQPILQNPITCDTVTCVFVQVIRVIFGIVALLATVMFVYGGLLFLTSGGNTERVQKGKDTLQWSVIGIVIVITSWIIIRFVLESTIEAV
jgi:hypothetical protein